MPLRTYAVVVLLLSFTVFAQNVVTNPTATQTIKQPVGTSLNVNISESISYSDQFNWTQSPTSPSTLTKGTQATVSLAPCPAGVDTSNNSTYQIEINSGAEYDNVVGGTCTPGAASGTITFTPQASYAAGYTVGSNSGGIQEAVNNACGPTQPPSTVWKNSACKIVIPPSGNEIAGATGYNVYGTIVVHASHLSLSGYGATLNCLGRGPCIQLGNLFGSSSNWTHDITVEGLTFRSSVASGGAAYSGSMITQTQRASQVVTITTSSAHGFKVGDLVAIMLTDNNGYWGDALITAVPSSTTFQYSHSGTDIASQTTPGLVALQYSAIADNAMSSRLMDLSYAYTSDNPTFNNFFDFWDDENALIDHFNSNGNGTNQGPNWIGCFVYSVGNQGAGQQVAPVITIQNSTFTNGACDVLDTNNNGLYILNSVMQAQTLWQISSSNLTGNYQGTYIQNLYSEPPTNLNSGSTPYSGTGFAGLVAGNSTGAARYTVKGAGPAGVIYSSPGSGTNYQYYIVAHDTTHSISTWPMYVAQVINNGTGNPVIKWPRVASGTDTISYDVIRTTGLITAGAPSYQAPYFGGCLGGSTTACGSVALNLAQCAGFVCSYTDNSATATASYPGQQGDFQPYSMLFWPGSIVTTSSTVSVDTDIAPPINVGNGTNPVEVANFCQYYGDAQSYAWIACLNSYTASNNSVPNQTALILSDGGQAGGGMLQTKGRLNFATSQYADISPHHIITLIDSNPGKTESYVTYRPLADAADTWIGTDVSSAGAAVTSGQLAFGSPIAISKYINNVGDNANYLERLSSTSNQLAVPLELCVPSSAGSCPSTTNTTASASFIRAGAGTPSGSCSSPTLYLNTSAASASTFLYVCVSGSTWTAITVP